MSEDINVELPADESIEEAKAQQMPVGTEADSIKSVDKAEEPGKKAKARKGDRLDAKDEPAGKPKTKAAMINAMYGKMAKAKKEELSAMYNKMVEEGIDFDAEEETVELPEFNYSEELNALVESEATLSDDFKAKTSVIFETAIKSKIAEEIERLEDEYETKLDESVQTMETELVEKVDNYLNYVVETWMEENKLAVESGLRTEIAEGFMNSLKDLFVESYIEVPDSKVDLVDELAGEVEELEEKLSAEIQSVLSLRETLESLQRDAIIRESSFGLAETEVEKLNSLVSSLDFEDEESFAEKVQTVKESYFKKEVKEEQQIDESWEENPTEEVTDSMSRYLQAIKRTHKE